MIHRYTLTMRGRISSHVCAMGVRVAMLVLAALSGASRPLPAQSHSVGMQTDPQLAAALADVDPSRIRHTDSVLVAFGTRHAMSDTLSSTRGVGAARRYLFAQMQQIAKGCNGCLRVEYDPASIEVARHPQKAKANIVNVLGWLPGRDTSRVIVMGGHYDSCICNVNAMDSTADAPGADDDGSGTSAVLELARVFAKRYPHGLEATVIFALYSGEELGLLGSTHLADRLTSSGYTVVAGMTDDIVGNVEADDGRKEPSVIRIFSDDPDNGPGRELARTAWAAAEVYQSEFRALPVFRLDRIGRGGDHAPFARKGLAGLRFTEYFENYKRQHLPTDDFAHVDFDYVARVARFNAAVVGSIGLAPATPDSVRSRRDRASGGQKWELTWKAVPGATAYEILIRRTSAPTWEKVIPVGAVTLFVIDDQLDDLFAGVRAVGANGHRSMASVLPAPTPVRPR